jgi:cystathionine gamma-synthase
VYARADSAAYEPVEAMLNALEGGQGSLLFSSGMAAATAVFDALPRGAHVIAAPCMYWALRMWLEHEHQRSSLAVTFVNMQDAKALKGALQPGKTVLVWVETPANPTWDVVDIEAVATLAHAAGAQVVVDSTVATPVLTRPLAWGADMVMHSATKYLNGHSDVLAGTLTTRDVSSELWAAIVRRRREGGAVAGSFESWLLLRGLRTLALRVERASRSALELALRFEKDPRVSAVLYPGLPRFPGHALAAKQMAGGFGGMVSLRVLGGEAHARQVLARVKLWKRATSLGGTESLVEHRAPVEGPGTLCPPDLLRLSVGIEDCQDLMADLDQALGP